MPTPVLELEGEVGAAGSGSSLGSGGTAAVAVGALLSAGLVLGALWLLRRRQRRLSMLTLSRHVEEAEEAQQVSKVTTTSPPMMAVPATKHAAASVPLAAERTQAQAEKQMYV